MQRKLITDVSHNRGNFKTLYQKSKFLKEIKQVSTSVTYPGVIKAFHKHKKQTDIWYVVSGDVWAITYDEFTNTKREFFLGENSNDDILVIPPNTWHGYKVLGNKPATMLYLLDQEYDPDDEIREKYDRYSKWKIMNK